MEAEEIRTQERSRGRSLISPQTTLAIGLIIGLFALGVCFCWSLAQGAKHIPLETVYEAMTSSDGSTEQIIVRTVRLPRSLMAIAVGAALAVAGAIMQGLTNNPLADPGILGLESGAALAVVLAAFIYGNPSFTAYAGFAFVGAGITAIAVYGVSSLGKGGVTPLNLTVAGAACSALLSSMTTAILLLSQRTLEDIRFWLAGSLSGRDIALFNQVLPYIVVGLVIALVLGKQITILNLGEDIAQGLGQPIWWVKITAAVSVVLLAGSAVAIAGPVGFVGLVVPHVVRMAIGFDYAWILPYSAIIGAILLLSTDIVSRILIPPQELPVGIVSALIGAPFFVYLTRKQVKHG
ncbi:FecCD family ABC transporter permease [Merismopedia glauca]|uniref:Iron ABC transporter permease n=1 Tax=Merismopedia glauca CCAP 1448/3 TaxID=1296344 RepID=A0A2T1C0E7_9CYAN|nr:iron ABC transporter permease [Merismopedia glauca]PSB01749.1 iron ABC transporter permease [Merismopedia glauca CCAP 1448/3]